MAASMCDVFSFCVGVAGGARGSVEVRFVNSAKVRSGRTPPGEHTRDPCLQPGVRPTGRRAGPCSSRDAGSVLVPGILPGLVAKSCGGG